MSISDIVIGINVLFFMGMGTVALVSPPTVTSYFGLLDIPADFRNEVRAVYGGFGVAVSVLLAAAKISEPLRAGIIVAISISLLGMACGRIVSWSIERTSKVWPFVFLILEVFLGFSLLWTVYGNVI